jgi:phosphatidylglycerophosphatase A
MPALGAAPYRPGDVMEPPASSPHGGIASAVASLWGVGHLRPAPGTWASVLTALIAWPCAGLGLGFLAWVGVGTLLALLGLWAVRVAVDAQADVIDPPWVVIDEAAGMWFALLLTPPSLAGWLLAVAVFRWLDICKPWLVGAAERRLPGAVGVMADDLVAGILAAPLVPMVLAVAGWLV